MTQKILLVEDDPCFGSVLQSYLQLSDYEVTLRVNGNEGLNAFRREKFDICLLDVMMPEMDGFTLGKKIREIDPSVPFVYITAKSLKEDMKLGYEIGADDFIVKHFDQVLVQTTVNFCDFLICIFHKSFMNTVYFLCTETIFAFLKHLFL